VPDTPIHHVHTMFPPHPSVDSEDSRNVPLALCEAVRIRFCRKPTVPGTARSATQPGLPPFLLRNIFCLTPPLHVVRGASGGGRLGGRPQHHFSVHNLQLQRAYFTRSLLTPAFRRPYRALTTGNTPRQTTNPLCERRMPKLPSAVGVACKALLAIKRTFTITYLLF